MLLAACRERKIEAAGYVGLEARRDMRLGNSIQMGSLATHGSEGMPFNANWPEDSKLRCNRALQMQMGERVLASRPILLPADRRFRSSVETRNLRQRCGLTTNVAGLWSSAAADALITRYRK